MARHKVDRKDAMVIGGASVGTVFEWYDFYLYGSLATYITRHFFSGVNETTGYIFALLAFAAGFAVRPFGALIFGRLGDLWGRKNTFLVTMLLMGVSTFAVGLLPSYASVGVIAPIALVSLRLLQGLALGGEYGGAATYVAEHAPPGRRGFSRTAMSFPVTRRQQSITSRTEVPPPVPRLKKPLSVRSSARICASAKSRIWM